MCCRYWTEESPELREIVEEMNRSPLLPRRHKAGMVKAFGEMRPTDVVPVLASDRNLKKAVFPMKWGYSGRTLLMNARTETASEKPMFREDWQKHRCIVPASWYFEWEHLTGPDGKRHTGEKYRIRPGGSKMTWLCGLYRIEQGLPSFVILTREPGREIRFIHDRMPLIMPEELVSQWIRPDVRPAELLPFALTEMVYEKVPAGV